MGLFFHKPGFLNDFSLKSCSFRFSLDGLTPGIDNVRFDVLISPGLREKSKEIIFHLVFKHAAIRDEVNTNKSVWEWNREKDAFKRLCSEVMLDAVHKAKLKRENHIDFLVQTALAKLFLDEIRSQYVHIIELFKNYIRKYEIDHPRFLTTIIQLKEELTTLLQNRNTILRRTANELFTLFCEVQNEELREIRLSNFGAECLLPHHFFLNPILHVENTNNDFFFLENYVLFGHRLEDPVRYETVISLIRDILTDLFPDFAINEKTNPPTPPLMGENHASGRQNSTNNRDSVDCVIGMVDNFDTLFNPYQTRERINALKRRQENDKIKSLRDLEVKQQLLLDYIYKRFKKKGMIAWIAATDDLKPICDHFCPPLFPLDVLKYLIYTRERDIVIAKLKRSHGTSSVSANMRLLNDKIKQVKRISTERKKHILLHFIKATALYHFDLGNYKIIKEAMDWINLVFDDKTANLSRVNHTLYEFLQPEEEVREEQPVINHVIIKTDVRGSTEITRQLKDKGLNPASYFSLNFFDPITAILSKYGASKVFIEGDAIILSIFEYENMPSGWYSVARACGLAINIILIVKRYNAKTRANNLPNLEQGIGISYLNTPPTFLFDGDSRIMISPAINQADRLSSCSRIVRKKLSAEKKPFNLYVFQANEDDDPGLTSDSLYRYNVNGIELNPNGFKKLNEEIDLKFFELDMPELGEEKVRIYSGTFPTMTSNYQRLLIREAPVPIVSSRDLSVIDYTSRNYYEVCTNPRLYEHIKRIA